VRVYQKTNKNSVTKIEPVTRTPPVGVVDLFYLPGVKWSD